MENPDLNHPKCDMCPQETTKRCAGCNQSRFSARDFALQTRPGPKYRRAIYFPEDDPSPRFIWLQFGPPHPKLIFQEPGQAFPTLRYAFNKPHTQILNLPDLDLPAKEDIQCNAVTKRYLARDGEKYIRVRYRDNFFNDGSKPNRAMESVINHSSKYVNDWRGPLVCQGVDPVHDVATDLDTTDLQHLIDYFNTSQYLTGDKSTVLQSAEGDCWLGAERPGGGSYA